MTKKDFEPLLDVKSVLPVLNKISILGGLSDDQLYSIFRLLNCATYAANDIIFDQGEDATHIYIVLSGMIKMVTELDETPMELEVFGAGRCFGETAVIGIQPHSATAYVIEDSEILILPRDALLSIYERDKTLFGLLILNIAREACRRLHHTQEVSLHYALHS